MLIAGGNDNIVEDNYFFDNWRRGTMLLWVPATLRGEKIPCGTTTPPSTTATPDNCMSLRPAVLDPDQVDFNSCPGSTDRNGVDFWWDEEEGLDCDPEQSGCTELAAGNAKGNCWGGNTGVGGTPTSDPVAALLPACPGLDLFRPGNSGEAGNHRPVRDLDRARRSGDADRRERPARLRLVHHAFRALAREPRRGILKFRMGKRAAIAAALSVAGCSTAAGCGGDDAGGNRPASLVWDEKPTLYTHPTLKDDRILRGEVKNGGLDKLRVEAADVKLLDADGRQVPASPRSRRRMCTRSTRATGCRAEAIPRRRSGGSASSRSSSRGRPPP